MDCFSIELIANGYAYHVHVGRSAEEAMSRSMYTSKRICNLDDVGVKNAATELFSFLKENNSYPVAFYCNGGVLVTGVVTMTGSDVVPRFKQIS